jgi:hypothetical protein
LPNEERKALLNRLRKQLIHCARDYQAGTEAFPGQIADALQSWQEIESLSKRLEQELSFISEVIQYFNYKRNPEASQTLRRNLDRQFGEISKIKDFAKRQVSEIKDFEKRTDHLRYQVEVLRTWTDFGGKLRFSRSNKGPQGPLIRFFCAVTGPVMGVSAPSVESIPNIIRRQKKILQSPASPGRNCD